MIDTPRLKIFRAAGAGELTRAHDTDAGYDMRAAEDAVLDASGTPRKIATSLYLEIDREYFGEIAGRSSMGAAGIGTMQGTIDPGYRGEVRVVLHSIDGKEHKIRKGDRIAQLILHRRVMPILEEVSDLDDLSESERGRGGFGSSGV